MQGRRVVVTGLGAVSCLGANLSSTWEGLLSGRSGIGRITRFDPSGLPSQVAGQAPEPELPRLSRIPPAAALAFNTRMGIAAACEAVCDAGLDLEDENRHRVGISLAAGSGFVEISEVMPGFLAGITDNGCNIGAMSDALRKHLRPHIVSRTWPGISAGQIAGTFNLQGPQLGSLTACSAGTQAIGDAARAIQYGDADVFLAGGTDSRLFPLAMAGYCLLRALCSDSNECPERACRPFDVSRSGFVISEGAGIAILESLQHARARDARIYAELVGFGSSADAFRVTDPHPEGRGAVLAMQSAMADAAVSPSEIDFIKAHGTSTRANDYIESLAIQRVFGSFAESVPVTSLKSMIGHATAAAGAVEFVGAVLALATRMLPPTINLEKLDPEIRLNVVTGQAQEGDYRLALCNSFGFGGQNACLVLRRWDG